MNETIFLVALFVAVLIIAYTIIRYILNRRQIARNLASTKRKRKQSNEDINKVLGSGNEEIRYYLDVVQNEPQNSLRMRLVQAGYFSKSALAYFNIIRFTIAAIAFGAVQFGIGAMAPSISLALLLMMAMVAAGVGFILTSAVLENMGKKRTREFRKLFPDFMDLLLVCVDAGLSINAAIDRVTREFLLTTRDFGVQLSIINLEIRAGRPLHEALSNFSKRIAVEEAQTLAVLFKQSEELGASVSKTLRVFSKEMRQMRLIRAEEKANALPIKMLFPMALFMFPVNLIIVLVPILLVILEMLSGLAPR
ncbi:type II secretion system F family protein [Roseovarius faecimaris]|uniref:Type II secretion system F family protein n=1 Tax=Roseovarius faecimaris TaxID=2494550 RepID=A0A6I6ISK6_9RHOB|nr:type II secretion system F family protein [Roseovarius faecimaris]QGY00211.1 type II secretion system F family protein [Roseovarius faecimaris]